MVFVTGLRRLQKSFIDGSVFLRGGQVFCGIYGGFLNYGYLKEVVFPLRITHVGWFCPKFLDPHHISSNHGSMLPIGSMYAIYIYIVTFTINIPQSCIAYMDPMGYVGYGNFVEWYWPVGRFGSRLARLWCQMLSTRPGRSSKILRKWWYNFLHLSQFLCPSDNAR